MNKYSDKKIFQFTDKMKSLPEDIGEILPPLHVRLKPTNLCNHRCWYCSYRKEDVQLGKDMSVRDFLPKEKIIEIIEDFDEMGVKAVTFSGGGEPLSYKYLDVALERLIKTDIRFACITNGSMLKDKIAEIFSECGTWLRISMDGWDDNSYMDYRGVPFGEYTKIVNNINSFQKLGGKCLLGVSLIIDEKNYTHIYEMTKTMKDLGANTVKISPCVVSNDGKQNNEYHKAFYQSAKEMAMKAASDLEDENFEVFDAYHALDEKFSKNYTWCPYLQILPVIGADQNVYSCQDKAYNLDCGIIGSIKNIRFRDFWMNEKEKFFKIDPSKDCNHHCVSNAKNRIVLDYLEPLNDHVYFV